MILEKVPKKLYVVRLPSFGKSNSLCRLFAHHNFFVFFTLFLLLMLQATITDPQLHREMLEIVQILDKVAQVSG